MSTPPGRWAPGCRGWTPSGAWSPGWPPAGSPPSSTSARCDAGRIPRPTTSRWRWRAPCCLPVRSPGRRGSTGCAGQAGRDDGSGAGAGGERAILRVAAAPYEADRVRQAAVAALGDRGERDTEVLELIGKLATTDGELGAVATLAAFDLGERSPEIRSAGAGTVDRPAVPARRPRPRTEQGRCRRQRRHRHHAGAARRRAGGRAGRGPGADDVPRQRRGGGGGPVRRTVPPPVTC